MAKIGEGDDRWIVDDLGEKGRNVGNWHWEEKDITGWCKDVFSDLFKKKTVIFKSKDLFIESTGIKTVDGECSMTNRKNRIRHFFELNVTFGIHFELLNEKKEGFGVMKLLEMTESDDQVEDLIFEMSVNKTSKEHEKVMKKRFYDSSDKYKTIQDKLDLFFKDIRSGGPLKEEKQRQQKGKTMNKEEGEAQKPKENIKKKIMEEQVVESIKKQSEELKNISDKEFQKLHLRQRYRLPVSLVFECFSNMERMSYYTQSKCEIIKGKNAFQKDEFKWLNGVISGMMVQTIENQLIEMKWRFNDWKKGQYSHLKIKFKATQEKECTVDILQENIPMFDQHGFPVKEKLVNGWKQRFLQKIGYMYGSNISAKLFI